MTSQGQWVINAPTAVSEVIDGELVVINLEKGSYYSSDGIGAYLWQCVEQQVESAAILAALTSGFGLAPEQARSDLESFLGALKREGLVREAGPDDKLTSDAPGVTGRAYAPPELKVYSDMQDLLLLDPIHDVGEEGWPTKPRTPDQ
jgi:hypothetical protein